MEPTLFNLNGHFLGEGINHEGQPFKAKFSVTARPTTTGLTFTFEAFGNDGTNFHKESSLLGPNFKRSISLWVCSSNHPAIFERELRQERKTENGTEYVFGFGNKEDKGNFREEILIEVQSSKIRYIYFWGMPGGDFAERSGCLMTKV